MSFLKKQFLFYCCAALIVISFANFIVVKKQSPLKKSQTAPAHHIIWGASCAPFPGEKIERKAAWIRLNDKIKSLNGGYGLQGRRTYDKGLPETWEKSTMAEDADLCKVSFGSVKPDWNATASGANRDAIIRFIRSIPDDRIVYLAFHHEPEDDMKRRGYSNELLQTAFAKFVDAVLAAGKPNVHPCFVLMSYTFRPQSGRNADDFNMAAKVKPEQLKQVLAGIDGYAHDPAVSAKETFEGPIVKMGGWGFSRFGIFETATRATADVQARAKWIDGLGQWANSRNDIELVSWFNSGVGPHAGAQGWFLGNWVKNGESYSQDDTDGSVAAYAKLVKPH